MVGLGETRDELTEAFEALREVDVDILTIGQYLRPSLQHLPLERYYHPDEFAEMKVEALALGFKHVESAPLVRSSYHARDQVPGAELKRAPPPGDHRCRGPGRPARGLTSGRLPRASVPTDGPGERRLRSSQDRWASAVGSTPSRAVILVVVVGLAVAIVKPWSIGDVVGRAALLRSRPHRPRSRLSRARDARPDRDGSPGPSSATGVPTATWDEVEPVDRGTRRLGRPGDPARSTPESRRAVRTRGSGALVEDVARLIRRR